MNKDESLVSIIIPCYNYASFVGKAIESVLSQNVNKEIIVIDDGSTDNLAEVVSIYPDVRYYYQENKGLAAARNFGIEVSKGSFLVFLDADDWFLPGGLETNFQIIKDIKDVAFVAGGFITIKPASKPEFSKMPGTKNPYHLLLSEGCYLQMIHSIIFRADVIKKYLFDETLRAAEDFDIYLRITKDHKIYKHNKPVVAYWVHGENMTSNSFYILDYAIKALKKQTPHLSSSTELRLMRKGVKFLTDHFFSKAVLELRSVLTNQIHPNNDKLAKRSLMDLVRIKTERPMTYENLRWEFDSEINSLIKKHYLLISDEERFFLRMPASNFFKLVAISPVSRLYLTYLPKKLFGPKIWFRCKKLLTH